MKTKEIISSAKEAETASLAASSFRWVKNIIASAILSILLISNPVDSATIYVNNKINFKNVNQGIYKGISFTEPDLFIDPNKEKEPDFHLLGERKEINFLENQKKSPKMKPDYIDLYLLTKEDIDNDYMDSIKEGYIYKLLSYINKIIKVFKS